MKIVTASTGGRNLQISHSEWLRIGERAGWIKTAQNIEVITPAEVQGVVDSMGTTRFKIGYRKVDGSFREIETQRRVNKYRKREDSDPSRAQTRREHGMILVFDLAAARKIVSELEFLPDETEEERAELKERALRWAYRSIYPDRIELIKGRGRIWLVEGALDPTINQMINQIRGQQENEGEA